MSYTTPNKGKQNILISCLRFRGYLMEMMHFMISWTTSLFVELLHVILTWFGFLEPRDTLMWYNVESTTSCVFQECSFAYLGKEIYWRLFTSVDLVSIIFKMRHTVYFNKYAFLRGNLSLLRMLSKKSILVVWLILLVYAMTHDVLGYYSTLISYIC